MTYPSTKDTSIKRTSLLVPMVSVIEGFHWTTYTWWLCRALWFKKYNYFTCTCMYMCDFIVSLQFEDIRRYQRSKFQFPSDDRLQNYCMNIWSLEEHEYVLLMLLLCCYYYCFLSCRLYDISCVLEPRELVLDSSTDS